MPKVSHEAAVTGRSRKRALIAGVAIAIAIAVIVLGLLMRRSMGPQRQSPLRLSLDEKGPYALIATESATRSYKAALDVGGDLHPHAKRFTFDPANLDPLLLWLREFKPYYALIYIQPDELDVNLGWKLLNLMARVDSDPFVDVRYGFVTGRSPASAADFIARTRSAVRGEVSLQAMYIDDLGPNQMTDPGEFKVAGGSFIVPILGRRMGIKTISHGTRGFGNVQVSSMKGAGILHFGGHGYPDRIVDGLTASQAEVLDIDPCVVFSGACYTGVTGRWFEMFTQEGTVAEHTVSAEHCFALSLLSNKVIAYLAALHPDHGIPVYQEMEYMMESGASLGEVMKHTYDGVVLANGGRLPLFDSLAAGRRSPQWLPADIMLRGTSSRILYGDPALRIVDALAEKPLEITVEEKAEGALVIGGIVESAEYKATFTDTYHSDMSEVPNQFNDRALITVDLPPAWRDVGSVEVLGSAYGSKSFKHRLVGWAVEEIEGKRLLHVQVDFPTEGYMKSTWRNKGAAVGIRVRATP